jgi:hypothetical protein
MKPHLKLSGPNQLQHIYELNDTEYIQYTLEMRPWTPIQLF